MSRTIRRQSSHGPQPISSAAHVHIQRRRSNRRTTRTSIRTSPVQTSAVPQSQPLLVSSGHVGIVENHTDDLVDKD